MIITMVADDAALKEIHEGGFRDGAQAGKMVIDMSTVSPATSRELAGQLATKGVDYLDAPVAGSVKPAELGQLVIMAAGKKETYEAALPIFAREKGIRPEALLAVIGESAMTSGVTKMKTANIVEDNWQAAFALKHLAKDLRLALGQGLHTPGGIALHDSFQQALVAGWGEKDISAIFPFLEGKKV